MSGFATVRAQPLRGPHLNIYTQREIMRRERRRQWAAIQEADAGLARFMRDIYAVFGRCGRWNLDPPPREDAITVAEMRNPPTQPNLYYPGGPADDERT